MYLARQLFDILATPLVLALVMSLAAAIAWIRSRKRLAKWLLAMAGTLVYAASLMPVGEALLAPLEQEVPSLSTSAPRVAYVVVLGSSYSPRENVSVVAALDEEGLVRIVEAVRLTRALSRVRLVVSGGAPEGRTPSAWGYALLARELGVDTGSVIVLDRSLNTRAEARSVAALIGSEPFLLVTSAFHMLRATRMMQQAGAQPIPVPTGQQSGAAYAHYWNYFLPSSTGLRWTECALHEYLGLAASVVRLD